MNPDLIAEIRAALEIIGNWKIGPPGGRTGFGKHLRYIYADGISIRVSGDDADRVAMCLQDLRNHAPALLNEIERLRARVAELEAERDEQNTVLREATQKLVELNVENAELEAEVESSRRARVDGLEAKVDYKICSNCKYEEIQSTLEPCASCVGKEYPGWEPKEYAQ